MSFPGHEYTTSERPADIEGQTRREPLLTEADVKLLAEAIKAGSAPDGTPRPQVIRSTLWLMVAVCALAGAWVGLHSWHPPVNASYTGSATTLTNISMGSIRPGVSLSPPEVYARSIVMSGPATEPGRLVLPIPQRDCGSLALELRLTCTKGSLAVPASISLTWSSPQLMFLNSAHPEVDPTSLVLQVLRPNAPAAGATAGANNTDVTVTPTGRSPIEWCTSPNGGTLTLDNGPWRATVPAGDLECPAGLPLVLQTVKVEGLERPPQTTFGAVTDFQLGADTGSIDARALGGALYLGGDTEALDPPTELALSAGTSRGIHVAVDVNESATEITIKPAHVTWASTGGTNLVTSVWDRYSSITLPLFLAATSAVISLFTPLFHRRPSAAKKKGADDQ